MFPPAFGSDKIFWAGGMTGESGCYPLGLAMVPIMAPSKPISKLEWRPYSSAMGGSGLAGSLELREEDGRCGKPVKMELRWVVNSAGGWMCLSFSGIDRVSPQSGAFFAMLSLA